GIFALNGSRNSFLNSIACDSAFATGAPLPDIILPAATMISVYPNPFMNVLNIKAEGVSLAGQLAEIYTIEGKRIAHHMLTSNSDNMNVSTLPAGMYILKIGQGKERKNYKVVKL
ncbi:MAG TPA: T9SS type A sorting domain-containing protein, partial [Ferruginibacter sp.]|nr:T9SS type A sorting domain-containing protein [Ferruginibacter sp.]